MDLFDFISLYMICCLAICAVSFGCRLVFPLMNPERDITPAPLRVLAPIGILLSILLLCCAQVEAVVLPQNMTAQEIRAVPSVLFSALLFLCTAILSGTLGYHVRDMRSDDAAISRKAYSNLLVGAVLTASAIAFILILWASAAKNIALGTGQVERVMIRFCLDRRLPVCLMISAGVYWAGWLVNKKTATAPASEDSY